MASPVFHQEATTRGPAADERREWVRINDRLLIEYRVISQQASAEPSAQPTSGEALLATLRKPTADLLAREGETLAHSPLLPWLRKIDWMLEALLASLSQIHPGSVSIAQVTDVNISGGGIEYDVTQPLEIGQTLALKIILPPFVPIQACAQVIRVTPFPADANKFRIATQFTALDGEAHDQLIRYILQTQAEQLRTRRSAGG
jgi:hypothetical protein